MRHHADISRAWFNAHDRVAEARLRISRNLAIDDIFRHLLTCRIKGGLNREAAPVEEFAAILFRFAKGRIVEERAGHVVAEETAAAGSRATRAEIGDLEHVFDGLILCRFVVLLADIAQLVHVVKHLVAPLGGVLRMLHGVIAVW